MTATGMKPLLPLCQRITGLLEALMLSFRELTKTHTHPGTLIPSHTHTLSQHIHTHNLIYTHSYTHTLTYIQSHTFTYTQTHTHTITHSNAHTPSHKLPLSLALSLSVSHCSPDDSLEPPDVSHGWAGGCPADPGPAAPLHPSAHSPAALPSQLRQPCPTTAM